MCFFKLKSYDCDIIDYDLELLEVLQPTIDNFDVVIKNNQTYGKFLTIIINMCY